MAYLAGTRPVPWVEGPRWFAVALHADVRISLGVCRRLLTVGFMVVGALLFVVAKDWQEKTCGEWSSRRGSASFPDALIPPKRPSNLPLDKIDGGCL